MRLAGIGHALCRDQPRWDKRQHLGVTVLKRDERLGVQAEQVVMGTRRLVDHPLGRTVPASAWRTQLLGVILNHRSISFSKT
jgi:hypothetical protein